VSAPAALQWLLVGGIVAGSALYAAWTLMPASLRRTLAGAALRLPLPPACAAWLRVRAAQDSGCGCSGCDRNPMRRPGVDEPVATTHPVTLHRRLPR
jgi:hypothetical protein